MAGCTPALDWRSVDIPDSALVAQLPCRPGRFQRDMVVANAKFQLFMLSCEAAGVTYGIATAELGDPMRVEPVLEALAAQSRAAIHARAGGFAPFSLPGATPFPASANARLRGERPDGRAVDESVRLFVRGSRLFEVSAIGESLSDEALQPFEDGLRFDLSKKDAGP